MRVQDFKSTSRATLEFMNIDDGSVTVPGSDPAIMHLQFRRLAFAGCPKCNLHARTVGRRQAELTAAGGREIVLFHSNADPMRPFQGDVPFDVVGDPERAIYDEGRHLGLPADFLIDAGRGIVACMYGVHADDQRPVDELLEPAKR